MAIRTSFPQGQRDSTKIIENTLVFRKGTQEDMPT